MVEQLFSALLSEAGLVASLEFVGLAGLWMLLKAERRECAEQRKEQAAALNKMADAIYALNGLLQGVLSKRRGA